MANAPYGFSTYFFNTFCHLGGTPLGPLKSSSSSSYPPLLLPRCWSKYSSSSAQAVLFLAGANSGLASRRASLWFLCRLCMLSSAFSSVSRSYAARGCRRPRRSNCHFWRRIVDDIVVVVVVVVFVARGGGRGRADGIILEDEAVKRLARGTVENDVELARMDVCVIKYRVWGKVSWSKSEVVVK